MKANIEKLENSKVKMEIEVDAAEFDKAIQRAYLKARGSISIPGFRKGKAPRKVIERYYGEGIFYEDAVNETLPAVYEEAVKEHDLFPVDNPDFDIVQIGNGENLILTAEVTVKPDIQLGQYKGIEINKVEYNVTDQEVDEALERVHQQNARWISVEDRVAQEGDLLTIDYKGYVDGEAFEGGTAENHSLEIGSGQFIPGFEEQLIGMNIDEERDIKVTFPEEYHAEDLKGKEATFSVKVHEIKEKELPELDDEFIKDISEFDSIDEYKADLRKSMEDRAEENQKRAMENQLLEKVAGDVEVDIPEVMVDSQIDQTIQEMEMNMSYQGLTLEAYLGAMNQTRDDLRDQVRDDSYNRVKLQLALEEIIKEEAIEVTEEELEDEYSKIAEQYNMDVDNVKASYGSQEASMKNSLAIQKAISFLMEQAVVVEGQLEAEESQELEESQEDDA